MKLTVIKASSAKYPSKTHHWFTLWENGNHPSVLISLLHNSPLSSQHPPTQSHPLLPGAKYGASTVARPVSVLSCLNKAVRNIYKISTQLCLNDKKIDEASNVAYSMSGMISHSWTENQEADLFATVMITTFFYIFCILTEFWLFKGGEAEKTPTTLLF